MAKSRPEETDPYAHFMNIGFDSNAISIKVSFLHSNFLKLCILGSTQIYLLDTIF